MKVAVWCPSCSQKYSVSQKHLEKRMRCKKCSHAFVGRDSSRPPSVHRSPGKTPQSAPTMAGPASADEPVEAEVLEKPSGVDTSQYFIGGSPRAAATTANIGMRGYPSQPAIRHESSPWMVPAVLAAIILPLILAVVCFLGKAIYNVGSIAHQVNEKAKAAEPEENPLPVNPHEIETEASTVDHGANRSGNSGLTENKSRKKSPAEIHAAESERATAKIEAEKLAAKARAERDSLALLAVPLSRSRISFQDLAISKTMLAPFFTFKKL